MPAIKFSGVCALVTNFSQNHLFFLYKYNKLFVLMLHHLNTRLCNLLLTLFSGFLSSHQSGRTSKDNFHYILVCPYKTQHVNHSHISFDELGFSFSKLCVYYQILLLPVFDVAVLFFFCLIS